MSWQHLPAEIARPLKAYYRRKRWLGLVRVAAAAAVFYGLLVLAATHVDRFAFLDVATRRAMLLGTHLFAGLFALGGLVVWLFRRPTPRRVAYEMESRLGGRAGERYVTLEDVLRRRPAHDPQQPGSVAEELLGQLRASTAALSRDVNGARLVRARSTVALVVTALFVALLFRGLATAPGYQFPLMLARFYAPGREMPRASFVKIDVSPKLAILGRGDEAVIHAKIVDTTPRLLRPLMGWLGALPEDCRITIHKAATGGRDPSGATTGRGFMPSETLPMARVRRDLFLMARPDLERGFSHTIRSGNAQTPWLEVRVVDQPQITNLTVRVALPEYSGLAVQTIADPAEPIALLAGSRVELSFVTDQPLVEREILQEGAAEPIRPDWDATTRTGTHAFTFEEPTSLEIRVVGAEGFANVEPARVAFSLREDMAPSVRLTMPPPEVETVASAVLPVRARVEDDLGLETLAVTWLVNPTADRDRPPSRLDLPVEPPRTRTLDVATTFDLGKTGAVPGDVLLVWLRARDSAGSDGASRPVRVRVVPFTRGSDEHRRIMALGLAAKLIGQFVEAAGGADPPGSVPEALDPDVYEGLLDESRRWELALAEAPTFDSLLGLLEAEHYLTGSARHRHDVRMLRFLLGAAAGGDLAGGEAAGETVKREAEMSARSRVQGSGFRTSLPGVSDQSGHIQVLNPEPRTLAAPPDSYSPGPLEEAAADRLDRISLDIIPPLVDYRLAKNLTWRLFGMRGEALRIRDRLDELADDEEPDAEQLEPIERRAALYREALGDMGEELLTLARRVDALDHEAAEEIVGGINTSGYFLARGGIARRRGAAEGIAEQITRLLELLRPAYGALLPVELAARRGLEASYAAALRSLAAGPAPGVSPERWADTTLKRLKSDLALLSRDPLEPVWPRAVRLALIDGLQDVLAAGPEERAARLDAWRQRAAALLDPAPHVAGLAAREEALYALLELDWQTSRLQREDRISARERALETTLLRIEYESRGGSLSEGARRRLAAIGAMPLGVDAPDTPGEAAALLGPDPAVSWPESRSTCRQLAEALRRVYPLPPPGEQLRRLSQHAAETGGAIGRLAAALRAGSHESLPAEVDRTAGLVESEIEFMREAVAVLALRTTLLPGENRAAARDDALLAGLRSRLERYDLRTARARAALRQTGDGPPSAEQLARLSGEIGPLVALHEATAEGIRKLAEQYEQGEIEVPPGDLGEVLAASRRMAEIALAQGGGPEGADAARQFLAEFEEAAASLLASRARLVAEAAADVDRARSAAARDEPDAAAVQSALTSVRENLAELEGTLQQTGDGPLPQRVRAGLSAALARLGRLPDIDALSGATARTRLRFGLGELGRELAHLADELRGAASTGPGPEAGLLDHPPGLTLGANRYEAELARRRWIELARHARDRAALGVLEALAERPEPDRFEQGYAYAALWCRLVRSELVRAGGVRAGRRGHEVVADPLLEFLRAELERAKQSTPPEDYEAATKMYLDLMGDYLRY